MARRTRVILLAGLCLALVLGACGVQAFQAGTSGDPAPLFERAEPLKSADNAAFRALVAKLDAEQAALSPLQRWHLRYLHAWQKDYDGDIAGATALLLSIVNDSGDVTLRFRATATLINILAVTHHYEEAYERLNELVAQLPQIDDAAARFQGLGEASQLLTAAGQYDLALDYARAMLVTVPPGEGVCRARFWALHARFKSGVAKSSDPEFEQLIDTCERGGQPLFAHAVRADIADMYLREGAPAKAVALLRKHYDKLTRLRYGALISQVDVVLARGYLDLGKLDIAQSYASDALRLSDRSQFTQPLSTAYEVLYAVALRQADYHAALQWHEKYMAADKGYLNDVSARALAYQRVKQQVAARKQQIDALNNQNKILQLQQALDRKAVQASRLSIVLLLTILASIGFWLYRLRRSQKRFMRMARHDGLTGIFNRQHFVEQAERLLASARREGLPVCLVLLDLDHFKRINDTHGHAVGDLVLKRAVGMCHDQLRKHDIFGRLGGEEFGILLPGTSLARVGRRAEAIRQTIASTSPEEDTAGVTVSASLGVASTEQAGYDLRQLMADADDALYRAKDAGRNRVVLDGLEAVAPGAA
ncbi:GGDEF domain-containing protein [Dyella sp.]|jgi:diguanylate cyclase (GGDEF)-like protein|uniref:tetratricopeptide repeat-containing diguanylate cyclase n=1 Tax=Dyella sp. TaxID=1869338 RepID=UPI002D776F9E|nr:GGDEF domain-containing protein [Dyella sp.]HET6432487.1 GGDEF domain-containing protein [Dyella sp.]